MRREFYSVVIVYLVMISINVKTCEIPLQKHPKSVYVSKNVHCEALFKPLKNPTKGPDTFQAQVPSVITLIR